MKTIALLLLLIISVESYSQNIDYKYKIGISYNNDLIYYTYNSDTELLSANLNIDSLQSFALRDSTINYLPSFFSYYCKNAKWITLITPNLIKINKEFEKFHQLEKLKIYAPLDSGIGTFLLRLNNLRTLTLYELKCTGILFDGDDGLSNLQEFNLSIATTRPNLKIPLNTFLYLKILNVEGLVDNIIADSMFIYKMPILKGIRIGSVIFKNLEIKMPKILSILNTGIEFIEVPINSIIQIIEPIESIGIITLDKSIAFIKYKKMYFFEYLMQLESKPSLMIVNDKVSVSLPWIETGLRNKIKRRKVKNP